jgi:RHS repeat-associated protein
VLVTISDKKIAVASTSDPNLVAYYNADVVTASDYYPFGSQMPGRKFAQANSSYRYGFNGKEQDKETTGTSTYDYGFRIYSPALGRFLSVDPLSKSYPWYTPYQFAGNKPISKIDIDGLEEFDFMEELQEDGSIVITIWTGKSLLKEQFLKVTTETTTMFNFKYKQIQEVLEKAKYHEVTAPGTKDVSGFTMDLPITEGMEVMLGPGEIGSGKMIKNETTEKDEQWLTNASTVRFRLKKPEKYEPKIFGKGKSGTGSDEFTFNVEMNSGSIQFEYGSSFIADKYVITDGDGNILKETKPVSGDGALTIDFKDLKTPIIKVKVISSDQDQNDSRWFFKIKATESAPATNQNNNTQKKADEKTD